MRTTLADRTPSAERTSGTVDGVGDGELPAEDPRVAAALGRFAQQLERNATEATEQRIPDLVRLLDDAGIPSIVLKGPVTRQRLYADDEVRPTADVDLLVPSRQFRRAGAVPRDHGYEQVQLGGHADSWRNGDGYLDLHLTLPFVTIAPRRTFEVLSEHTTTLVVAGEAVPVLDELAHAVHLAVHAAQNDFDPEHRSFDEWRRGMSSLGGDHDAARAVAVQLGAEATWDLACEALLPAADRVALAARLPARKPEASLRAAAPFLRSPIPATVRLRATRAHLHYQLSPEVLDARRRDRGRPPIGPGRAALARARLAHLAAAPVRAIARSFRS